jgi:hypothetical protein
VTPLERLGLEVAAERLMDGQRGLGRLLVTLLLASPRSVSRDGLKHAIVHRKRGIPSTDTSVMVRVARLRSCLEDLGYPRTIVGTDLYGHYYISPADADKLFAALRDAAGKEAA